MSGCLPRPKESQSSPPVPGQSRPVPALGRTCGQSGLRSQEKPLSLNPVVSLLRTQTERISQSRRESVHPQDMNTVSHSEKLKTDKCRIMCK